MKAYVVVVAIMFCGLGLLKESIATKQKEFVRTFGPATTNKTVSKKLTELHVACFNGGVGCELYRHAFTVAVARGFDGIERVEQPTPLEFN